MVKKCENIWNVRETVLAIIEKRRWDKENESSDLSKMGINYSYEN